jgi:hypothetical protein
MVAGMIDLCGAQGGATVGPNKNNQKGMFENGTIRERIVKPYLKELGADPLGQYPIPDAGNLSDPGELRDRVAQIMGDQGVNLDQPWYYKGAKLALIWPVWAQAFPDAKWVIVRRRTGDVARSCCHTGFMQRFRKTGIQREVGADNEYDGWIWWVRQHEDRFREMFDAGLEARVVWPERFVHGDYSQVYEVIEWLGLEWHTEALTFVDPKLWKARKKGAGNG